MAAQRQTGAFVKMLGERGRKAHEAHKNDETKYGQMELPSGIENGVAQLVDIKFTQIAAGKQNAGKWMFYAAGVVKEPGEQGGTPVRGLRTSITEPMYDTPTRSRKTVEEHIAWLYNELRKLGVNTTELGYDDLESTVAALRELKPHFRFRTWKGSKQTTGQYAGQEPRVQHQWNGLVDYNDDGTVVDNGVVDNTPEEPEDEGGEAPADTSFEELLEKAKAGDGPASHEVQRIALENGISQEDFDSWDWDQIAEAVQASLTGDEGGGDAPEEPEAEEFKPSKGDVYNYQVIDPKTKKPALDPKTKKARKPIEVEVTAVNQKNKTVDIKDLANPKNTWKAVAWDDLKQS